MPDPASSRTLLRELIVIAAAPGIRLGTPDDDRRQAVELGLLSADPERPRYFTLTAKGRAWLARRGLA